MRYVCRLLWHLPDPLWLRLSPDLQWRIYWEAN